MGKKKVKPVSKRTRNTEMRNAKLYARYKVLTTKKTSNGRSFISFDAILDILNEEFFIERDYIARIISNHK